MQATLVQTGTGFLLTEAQGQTRYLFQPIDDPAVSKLTAIADRNQQTATDVGGQVSGFSYAAAAHLQTITDPRQGQAQTTYDALIRIAKCWRATAMTARTR